MQAFLSMVGVCAALVMCAVSAAMNYLFLSSLGKTPLEGQVLGAASAAADLLKALLPFFIAWSWRSRRIVAAGAGSLTFALFSGFSLLSAIGFAADNRGVITETREILAGALGRAQQELQDAEGRLAALPPHRPPSVVSEEIDRYRQNRRWNATNNCVEATEAQSLSYCERYFALRAELAAGTEEQRLTSMIARLKAESSRLQEAGAGQERDPQVSLLSRIFGRAHDSVRLALIVFVALLVETGSSLGLFLASGHSDVFKRQRTTESGRVEGPNPIALPPLADARPVGCIEDFCLEALVASKSDVLTTEQLFEGYQDWCRTHGHAPMGRDEFASDFANLAAAIGLAIVREGYRGIALAERERKAA